ncbi:MAG: phasin family protein [Methylobacteriaceae bacterium]|nr:phasin family protein [Methylobacteriaceae bacterium]
MDPKDKLQNAAKGGIDTAMAGFTTATKNMQVIAGEIAKMSMESYENSAQLIEKLRGAKSWEDIVAIQTGYMKTAYENFASRTQKLGEIMGTMPQEMARTYTQLFNQGKESAEAAGDAAKQAGEQAADQIKDATKT